MSNIIANILGSQSNSSSVIFRSLIDFKEYMDRVEEAGGSVISRDDTFTVMRFLLNSGQFEDTKLLFLSNGGCLQRTDGVLKYYRTAYDMSNENNDLNGSATASQQPRLVGGIAPNSKPTASNQNGEARYFTHPAISFGATDAWSASIVLNWNGNNETFVALVGNNYTGAGRSHIAIRRANTNRWAFFNDSQTGDFIGIDNTSKYIGKNIVVSFIASGSNNIKVYVGGVEKGSLTIATNMDFSSVFSLLSDLTTQAKIKGSISTYLIQSQSLTASEVADLHTTLRGLYPEIETATIGTQTWASRNFEAVATPVGNVINNVTGNGAVEKVTNAADREFSSDTGFWIKTGTATISGNVLNINSASGISKTSFITPSKYYKVTYTVVTSNNGSLAGNTGGSPAFRDIIYNSTVGTHIIYIKSHPSYTTFNLYSIGFIGTIDDLSIQELNWSNATEIYDAVYAATVGDAATKEYAALKEAAMWRYPNNDVNKGAWAGKLYNKYAKRLLALDMLSANFGYNLPSESDVDELLAYVGNDTNKLKYTGLNYWNDALGTNETGLTLLGTGVMTPEGVYVGEKELTGFWTSDSDELPTTGLPIRLIKDV